jgi:hypothetical protein
MAFSARPSFQRFGAFDQLAAMEVANAVAVDEGKAEAFGDAQCLGVSGQACLTISSVVARWDLRDGFSGWNG